MLSLGKKKINPEHEKELEQIKYMQAEISLLESKFADVSKIMSVGLPMTEMKTGIDKLDKIEQDLTLYKSNSLLITSSLKKLGALLDTLYEDVKKRPTLDRLEVVANRIDNLENTLAEFSGADSVKQLVTLIDLNRSLLHRVQNLEKIIEEELEIGVKPLDSKALSDSQQQKQKTKQFTIEFKPEQNNSQAEYKASSREQPLPKKVMQKISPTESLFSRLLGKKAAKGV